MNRLKLCCTLSKRGSESVNEAVKEILSMLAGLTEEQLKEVAKQIKEEVYDHRASKKE